MEQVAESSPFQRAAANPGEPCGKEPCAKKAKSMSALELPHGICETLTASLRIALCEGEKRATKPANEGLCENNTSLAPARPKAKPVQVGFYPSTNPNVDPFKYQDLPSEERRRRDIRNAKEVRRKQRRAAGL